MPKLCLFRTWTAPALVCWLRLSCFPALCSDVAAGKAVFEVEYSLSTSQFCPQANALNFNAMQKDLNLDAFRIPCR